MLNIHSIICSYYRLSIEHIQSTSSIIVSWTGKIAMGRLPSLRIIVKLCDQYKIFSSQIAATRICLWTVLKLTLNLLTTEVNVRISRLFPIKVHSGQSHVTPCTKQLFWRDSQTALVVLRSSEICPASLFFTDVILFLFLALDKTICFMFLVAVTTLDIHDFSAGFDPKPSLDVSVVGELVCCRADLQSTL